MIFAQAEAPPATGWLGLQTADWLVLVFYFVVILAIGLWSIRKVKDMADFFMGGRRFGKVFMMFFAFGAGTSSEQAISVVAGTWRAGLAGIWWQFLWLWATPFYWIVAPILRRTRALTTADFFESRYNTATATLYTIYGIIMSIVFIAGGLYGSGKMVNALTGGQLNELSADLDVTVPEVTIRSELGWFQPPGIFDAEAAVTSELRDGGPVPDDIRRYFERSRQYGTRYRPLSADATIREVEPGAAWAIEDKQARRTFPLRTVEVIVQREEAGETNSEKVDKIRVYASGYRRIEGYEYAILAMTVLFVAYGIAGGLGAAIITDFIQGVLTITFSFLLLPFVFSKIGGFGALHGQSDIKTGMLDFVARPDVAALLGKEPITAFYVAMLSITALAGIVVQPHIMGVCGAGKTEMEGRFGFTVGNFLKRFCTVAWTFTGLACIVWYLGASSPLQHSDRPLTPDSGAAWEELDETGQAEAQAAFTALPEAEQAKILSDRLAYQRLTRYNNLTGDSKLTEAQKAELLAEDKAFADELFGRAAYDILPTIAPGLIGLLLASLLAAVMSTSDAQMVISSGLFTENIYRRFFVNDASQRHYLWIGRIAGVIIVVMALLLQSTFTDVIDALKTIIKTPAIIGISLWFGISWRRWNSWAVWGSTICGVAAWILVAKYPDLVYGWNTLPDSAFGTNKQGVVTKIIDSWQMLSFMTVGIVSGIVISLLTPMQSKEKLDHFYSLMHTPVTPGEEVERPCTLPPNPAPQEPRLIPDSNIELPRPTKTDVVGFALAWVAVAFIIWMTSFLARTW